MKTHYTLPKRLLKILLHRLAKHGANRNIRSAANRIAHFAGQYHAAPKTFGRHFVLCREKIAERLDLSEYYFREGMKLLVKIGFLRLIWSAKKARFRANGFRKDPTVYGFGVTFQPFFPAASSTTFLKHCSENQNRERDKFKAVKEERPASRVYSGERHKVTRKSAFDAFIDAIQAAAGVRQ